MMFKSGSKIHAILTPFIPLTKTEMECTIVVIKQLHSMQMLNRR